jgi:hypothetical protein
MKENKDHHQVVMSTEHYESLINAARGKLHALPAKEVAKIDRHVRKFNYWRRIQREQELLSEAVDIKEEKRAVRAFLDEWEGKRVVFVIRNLYEITKAYVVLVVGPSRQVKRGICAQIIQDAGHRCVHAIPSCFMSIDDFNDYNRKKFEKEEAERRKVVQ